MKMLPEYRHPKGRSDAPCGSCGASALREPIFSPDFVWRNRRGPHQRYEPDSAHPPVFRCLTCWQKGEGFIGDDIYAIRETLDPTTFAQGGDWTFVGHAIDRFDDIPLEKCHVIVDRDFRKCYVPEPPRISESSEAFEVALKDFVIKFLSGCGMTPEHLRARVSRIPKQLLIGLDSTALTTVRNLLEGAFPTRGIFLAGGVGGGKTSAVAAWIIAFVTNYVRLHAPIQGWRNLPGGRFCVESNDFQWIYWPEQYAQWNTPEFEFRLGHAIERLGTKVRLLVLDDIAAEHTCQVFGKDQGTIALQRIIALRDTHRLPTLFTTNLESQVSLHTRYGPRTARRIERLNDCFYIPDLPFMDD